MLELFFADSYAEGSRVFETSLYQVRVCCSSRFQFKLVGEYRQKREKAPNAPLRFKATEHGTFPVPSFMHASKMIRLRLNEVQMAL